MVTLWIGDFRTKQIQNIYNAAQQTAEYHYIIDNLAEYSWFKNNAAAQLPLLSLERANIVILLGFNDCLYSCVWDYFKADKIAEEYSDTINELITDYSNLNFYICSVNPVNGDYPFAESKSGKIGKSQLNEKIGIFNTEIRKKCKAKYIDSYDYLSNTGFETRDGVRFSYDTCVALHNYISANFNSTITSIFSPRLMEPDSNKDTFLYWISTSKEGENPFPIVKDETGEENTDGFTLPSCEAYAWGRFYEIIGEIPALSTETANTWYSKNDGYTRGEEPRVGAIACWTSAFGGFVAVVEQVKEDGSIITSESDWTTTDDDIWQLTERVKGDGNWGLVGYSFQGFIYCPTIPTASTSNLDKNTVVSKAEALTKTEMEANAKYIWNYLGSKGWSLNAVAGMLGNMQAESTINPGRHQVGSGPDGGYGLVQWTPKSNLTSWTSDNGYAEDDMDGQLERIIWEKENGKQYIKNYYKYTFETFSTSLDNPYTLACAFAFDYERSNIVLSGTEAEKEALRKRRGTAAEEWYDFLAPFSLNTSTEEKFTLDNFRIKNLTPTEVEASFMIRNGTNGQYILFDDSDKELVKKPISISTAENKLQVITFKCDKKLIPNENYTLRVQATGIVGENNITRSITFKTPQDLPESIKSIKLSCDDKIISIDSIFKLNVEMPDNLGYWNKNNCGYEKILFVNGKSVKTIVVNKIKDIKAEKFKILDEFNYNCKIGDTIQIGIRIWVTDKNSNKIYDDLAVQVSEPICLFNNSIQTYLNVN